jgi:hypothetical protein
MSLISNAFASDDVFGEDCVHAFNETRRLDQSRGLRAFRQEFLSTAFCFCWSRRLLALLAWTFSPYLQLDRGVCAFRRKSSSHVRRLPGRCPPERAENNHVRGASPIAVAPPTVAAWLPLECGSASAVAFSGSHLCQSIKGRGLKSRGFETTSHTMKHIIAFRYLGEMLACSTSEFH